ncbi:MAG: SMC-Scp complex subunit ScpB [Neomegalonema sp.]|nr:SMC-Scp complex subunit ScpB [Neomegalonema sp.]
MAAAADEAKAQSSADGFSIPAIDEQLRMVEAMLFASASPLSTAQMGERMPVGCDPALCVRKLEERYASAGVQLVRVAGKWAFRTAPDLAFLMSTERVETRKLSRAGTETLAIIAYHQPVTRAEIEAIRGVAVSRGTIDQLMELEWIKLGRRRQSPGRPVTFVTTDRFLDHFGLDSAKDLPGLDELRQAGLLDRNQQGADDMPVGSGDDLDTDNGDDHEQFADDDAQEKDREKDREKDQGELLD